MDRQEINGYLEEQLGRGKYTAQGIKYCCPKPHCDPSQTKYNLEVNLFKHSKSFLFFNCWACHYKGHLSNLLKTYADSPNWRSIPELKQDYSNEYDVKIKEEVKLPLSFSFHLSEKIFDYLTKVRKIDENVLYDRKIKYCYPKSEKDYNSIIFPFYDREELIGYSSQSFLTKKYKNHRDLNFVPYKDFINKDFPIIITEGIYDALSVPNAIPLLGTNVSNEIYKFSKDKNIILALDKDVLIEAKKKIAEKFYFYGAKSVIIFNFEYKDLNEYWVMNKEGLKNDLKIIFDKFINES